ncbi:hypothetical protein ART_0166 [Arthrobacter sp. PAMC 25486]|uniref:hypothetical protein n=1 Tax=Arthrobacter sp. PAMC 25486 TaxID=1494608 RepID=UPI0005362A46|nr:hypothetical protein [Arthrobacter sp. PAMC 25486]AIX99764.1 hypothetical protein ART_0166 [Arthrobacter sp. PAMC 25486]
MDADEQIFHEHIHAANRSDVDSLRWELLQERARGRVKDAQIAELTALLDAATDPGE